MEASDFTKKLQSLSNEELLTMLTQSQKDWVCLSSEKTDDSLLHAKLGELEKKYFDLVWMARKNPKDLKDPNIKRIFNETSAKYPGELKKLQGKEGDWTHGFNSGMLAAVRLFSGYVSSLEDEFMNHEGDDDDAPPNTDLALRKEAIKRAEEEFPFLDT